MPLSSTNNGSTTASSIDYTTTNIPAFLSKLWTLVEDPKYDELIAWDPSGFSFHVFDQTRFSREILPRFFKHNNMASFIRQLNMYGFRKVNSIDHGSLKIEKQDMEFHHPYFIRGKEQFLEFIKRKVSDVKPPPNNQQSNQVTQAVTTNEQALSLQYPSAKTNELNKMLDDVNNIKSKQKMVDDSLFSVKKENEALWKEIASLRQKHHHQQQIVNKLIHFLVHLVNPSSLGIKRTTRPLMIDSHSTASFINLNDDEDQTNEVDNRDLDDEDEEYVNLNADNLRSSVNLGTNFLNYNKNNSNHQRKNQQLVELEDDDENVDNVNSEKRKSSYITEIETINMNKTNNKNTNAIINEDNDDNNATVTSNKNNSSNVAELDLVQPLNKKFKKIDNIAEENNLSLASESNVKNGNISTQQSDYLYNTDNGLNLKNDATGQETINTANDEGFLDPNLFLNSTSLNDPNGINQSPQSLPVNTPIVTLPVSPNPNNTVQTFSPNSQFINQTNGSNFRRTLSSSSMNDHIESLQIDLNSIKEYLANSSFSNQIDPYTINNLFSPIVLDQIENEPFYLEPPVNQLINNASVNNNQPITLNETNSNVAENNNGKIIGNEVIQFQPSDIFDDLFNNDLKEKNKTLKETTLNSTDPPNTHQGYND